MSLLSNIEQAIEPFPAIDLPTLESVPLKKRSDTKYVGPASKAIEVLRTLQGKVKILEVKEARLIPYYNWYFDTPSYKFFKDHHSGKLNRAKVRLRKYGEEGLHVLEQKFKSNKGKTEKIRIKCSGREDMPMQQLMSISKLPLSNWNLQQTLEIGFWRISLVNNELTEKATLDFGLHYFARDQKVSFEHLFITEVKQPRFSYNSTFVKALRTHKVQPTSFSKYCFGMANLYPSLKHNRFKKLFLKVDRVKRNKHEFAT